MPKVEVVHAYKVDTNAGFKYYHAIHTAIAGIADAMFLRLVTKMHEKARKGERPDMYHHGYDYDAWCKRMERRVGKLIRMGYGRHY